ncbi:efflux RND transporter periplasmic adaptor subunit [Persephonella sp.]
MAGLIRFSLFFLLPVLVLILWMGGYLTPRVEPGYAETEGKTVTGIKTDIVKSVEEVSDYVVDGSVISNNTAKVSTKLMARILEIKVKEGDTVKKGQLLAVLDDSEIKQNIKEAEAALEELSKAREEALAGREGAKAGYEFAKRTYERFLNLYKDNAVSKQQLEEIETKMIGAKAQLEMIDAKLKQIDAKEKQVKAKLKFAKIMQSYAYVKSPFDGVVIKKMNDVGDMAAPGMPIFLVGDKDLRFIAQIDEKFIDKVRVGDDLNVYIETLNKNLKGTVVEKSKSIDPMSRSFSIKIKIPYTEGLTPGMYGKIKIPVSKERKILIPDTALVKWGQLNGVYTVDEEGFLRLTFVKIGEKKDGKYEVLSGLEDGTEIVIENVEKACDGCKIR